LPAGDGFKPPSAAALKRRGGERLGKGVCEERQVSIGKMSVSEPLMTHRKSLKKLSKLRAINSLRISLIWQRKRLILSDGAVKFGNGNGKKP